MRIFRGCFSLGTADGKQAVRALHARLDDAVGQLDIQQNVAAADNFQTRRDIEDALRDLAAALLGKEISIMDDEGKPWQEFDIAGIRAYMEVRERNRHGRGGPYDT